MHQRHRGTDVGTGTDSTCADGNRGADDDEKESFIHGRKKSQVAWYVRCLSHPCLKAIPLGGSVATSGWFVFFAMPDILHLLEISGVAYVLHMACISWVCTMFLYNFAAAMFVDPGRLTRHIQPHDAITGQYDLIVPERFKEKLGTIKLAARYCNVCANWKPPRTHHCSSCGKCTLRMDHHCPFMLNCIGARNQGHFVLMYMFAHLGLAYMVVMCARAYWMSPGRSALTKQVEDMLDDPTDTSRLPHLHHLAFGPVAYLAFHVFTAVIMKAGQTTAITASICIFAMIFVSICGCPAVYFAIKNATLLEYHLENQTEYAQIDEHVYCPLSMLFFSRPFRLRAVLPGSKDLLYGILGEGGHWRFLLPIQCKLDIQALCLEPEASERGCESLIERIEQVKQQGVKRRVESLAALGIDQPDAKNQTDII
eukprot:GEMP01020845.1.p1 GENE.GEMP01020845.1~~GEMP01020845.1.p1  ORF type:complete len:425 (+),score=78.57 GEMP01020845.1:121-1395(+)